VTGVHEPYSEILDELRRLRAEAARLCVAARQARVDSERIRSHVARMRMESESLRKGTVTHRDLDVPARPRNGEDPATPSATRRDRPSPEEQDAATEPRDRIADDRHAAADERDRIADERDRVADDRQAAADERDRIADQHDRVADNPEP
jgi:hypothetical protein